MRIDLTYYKSTLVPHHGFPWFCLQWSHVVGAKAAHETRGRGHSLGVAALQDWRALGTYDALGTVTVWILVETTMVVFFFLLEV